MDDDFLDDLRKPGSPQAQHALLVAALLHLMSHYTVNSAVNSVGNGAGNVNGAGKRAAGGGKEGPCVKLASVIERHLTALARLPDADPVLRATCEQLSAKWADIVDSALPPVVPKRPLLARILRPVPRKVAAPAFAV